MIAKCYKEDKVEWCHNVKEVCFLEEQLLWMELTKKAFLRW